MLARVCGKSVLCVAYQRVPSGTVANSAAVVVPVELGLVAGGSGDWEFEFQSDWVAQVALQTVRVHRTEGACQGGGLDHPWSLKPRADCKQGANAITKHSSSFRTSHVSVGCCGHRDDRAFW